MGFSGWVTKMGGVTRVASLLGVTKGCVSQWVNGITLPRDDKKMKIFKLSRGLVTYADIMRNFNQKNKTAWGRK